MFRTKSGHLLRLLPPHLADINARTVAAYFEAREVEGAHYATLSKELSALKATLRSAKQCDLYSGDIGNLKPIWVKPSYVPRETFISWEDVPKLLAALEPARRAVVAFITATGARWSEAMSFQPGDLDRACWSILIRGTKTRKAWRNFIVPEAFRGLLDHVGGAFAPWGNVVRDLEIACKHAGVPRVSPSDLRRTFASLLVQGGTPLSDVATLLGHASTTMVFKVYGQQTAKTLAQRVKVSVPILYETPPEARRNDGQFGRGRSAPF